MGSTDHFAEQQFGEANVPKGVDYYRNRMSAQCLLLTEADAPLRRPK